LHLDFDFLPKITVITPSFNQGRFIDQTIKSVLEQNYPNLEYLVVDGGSTDETIDILHSYGEQITWLSESDRGQTDAINKGLLLATGEVIGYLNSDDMLMPGALLKVGVFFKDHPQISWLTGNCLIVDQNGQEIRRLITFYKKLWLRIRSTGMLAVMDYISQPATFWRWGVIERIGYFDEACDYAMDYDYWLRLRKYYQLYYLDETLACFRVHPESKGGSAFDAQFLDDMQVARRHIKSPAILKLHEFHNLLIVSVYRLLLSRAHRQNSSNELS
jgi:glycosyltransferase involved in cell wall biosynthesis